MKRINNVRIIILLIGIVLIIIGLIILIPTSEKSKEIDYNTIEIKNKYSITNLSIEKFYRWCTVEFDIVRDKLDNDDLTYYDAYFLDKNNNLLYIQSLNSFSNFEDKKNTLHVSFDLNYDVSDTTKIEIIFKGDTYKYNLDKQKDIKRLDVD